MKIASTALFVGFLMLEPYSNISDESEEISNIHEWHVPSSFSLGP
jgi:hypothetical protein